MSFSSHAPSSRSSISPRTIAMGDRLSFPQIVALLLYAAAMAGGQILFKLAAIRNTPAGSFGERLLGLIFNRYFVAAIILYAALTVFWVWILTFTPLSRAYIFVALAFVLTPFAGAAFFGEPISARLVIGIALVVVGLACAGG
jgi:drug/metabolite transporter (DMT)-like permease